MTTETEISSVSRETPALLPTPPEGASTSPADVNVLADARTEARSWAPNTRRAYVASWNDFTSWCLEHRCAEADVLAAARAAGLGEGFSGHSDRIGMARRMVAVGAPNAAVQNQGRWKHGDMVARYTQGEVAREALK